MEALTATQPAAPQPLAYSRFLPRLRAVILDSIILLLVIFGAIMIATAFRSDSLARPLGFVVAAFWLLYEPLFVSFAGATLGHRWANLRVVDDRTGGNVSFLKAVARAIIKGALGWVSFITMLTTRRSQAVHDLLTRSTVQIRDIAIAGPKQFVHERTEFASPLMPSGMRRAAAVVIYALIFTAIVSVVVIAAAEAGAVSDACYTADRCNRADDFFFSAAALVWIVGGIVILALGWRGLLFGARRRKA